MILTTKEGCLAEEILAYEASINQAIGTLDPEVTSIRKDTKWAKIIVHGISTVTYPLMHKFRFFRQYWRKNFSP